MRTDSLVDVWLFTLVLAKRDLEGSLASSLSSSNKTLKKAVENKILTTGIEAIPNRVDSVLTALHDI